MDGIQAAELPQSDEIDPLAIEVTALNSIVVDLAKVVEHLAPGVLDRALAESRIRLQQLETNRSRPAIEHEDLVLRFRVDMLERALGRTPTLV